MYAAFRDHKLGFELLEMAENKGYSVLLRNNETGEERLIKYPLQWDYSSHFLWTEGNYACDCNRHLFFDRAIGIEPINVECGENKYSALYALLPDGTKHELDLSEE